MTAGSRAKKLRSGRKQPRARKGQRAAQEPRDLLREIYAIVRAIPRGRVAAYGQIAELAGMPSGHRIVARAMRTCPSTLPWHRVVGKKDARRARIALLDPAQARNQRRRLQREGVHFDDDGFIRLAEYGWLPL